MRPVIALLALLVLLPPNASAADTEQSRDPEVARHIADLDSASFQTRSAARDQLLARGQTILPQLKAHLKDPKPLSAEAQLQLTTLIDLLTGGEAVDNLCIELKCDQERMKPGASATFSVRIKNLSSKPFYLQTGFNDYGNYFRLGRFFKIAREGAAADPTKHHMAHERAAQWHPSYELIEPRSILEIRTPARLEKIESEGKAAQWHLVFADEVFVTPTAVAGNYQVRLELHCPFDAINGHELLQPTKPLEPSIKIWGNDAKAKGETRQAKSNTISLVIEGI